MCYIKFEREHNMEKNNKIKDETAAKDFYVQDDRFYKIFDESKSVADILNEALNLARVEETGIRIPNFIELTSIDGRWALITKNVKGKNMAKLLEENPDKEDELLNRFVDIQIDIQNRKCPLLSRHIDKMNRKIAQTDLSATLRYDLHNRIESMLSSAKMMKPISLTGHMQLKAMRKLMPPGLSCCFCWMTRKRELAST